MHILKRKNAGKGAVNPEVQKLRDSLTSMSLVPAGNAGKKTFREQIPFFFTDLVEVLMKMKAAKNFRGLSNMLFMRADKFFPKYFMPLKSAVSSADMPMLPESYIGLCLGLPFLIAMSGLGVVIVESIMLSIPPVLKMFLFIFVPVGAFFISFIALYAYPFEKLKQKGRNIDTNLPFALNHLAAIASSGVPPSRAFEMLTEYAEYGAVSVEARNIVRRMNVFGEDLTQAMVEVSNTTPSRPFRDLLHGMLSITESGGNLKDYLNEVASMALFNYQLARKKYIETLSTYADIYTAILIAAPLFLVAILTVMNIIPGSLVGGLTVDTLMKLGVYVLIPMLNIGFIAFITYTQPEI